MVFYCVCLLSCFAVSVYKVPVPVCKISLLVSTVLLSVMAKTRAYLILAGAMLPVNDALLVENDKDVWRMLWFNSQKNAQLSLLRQCRYRIRMCLAHTRDIDGAILKLPIPVKLKNILFLEEDFQTFLTHSDDGGVYEETLQS